MQRVLIVDDSKTAQIKLKKMLLRYEVVVDLAFSAEEALGYLSHRIPAVIFLDHHMEGMDGLKALKLIKENPTTSTVPVIMYTSEKGEVYVSQARALGALDILSKDFMQTSSLEKLMGNLKLGSLADVPKPVQTEVKPEPAEDKQSSDINDALPHANTERVLEQISSQMTRLMEFHFNDVRQQLVKHNAILRTNVNDQISGVSREIRAIDKTPATEDAAASSRSPKPDTLVAALMVFLCCIVVYMGVELLSLKNNIKTMASEQRVLSEVVVANVTDALKSEVTQIDLAKFNIDAGTNPQYDPGLFFQVLTRGMQLDFQFDLGAEPLGTGQIAKIRTLVDDLMKLGFSGAIDIDVRFGNACWQKSDAAEWQLADSNIPAGSCTFSEKITPEFKVEDYLSLEFANFEQTLEPVQSGKIAFTVGTSGFKAPIQSYPTVSESLTAGAWNKVAAKNNRLVVTLFN